MKSFTIIAKPKAEEPKAEQPNSEGPMTDHRDPRSVIGDPTDEALPGLPANENVSAKADVNEFWRSMNELEGTAEFDAAMAREFGSDTGAEGSGVNRRRFVQLMSASLALAGASGCRWDKKNIHSFTRSPQSHTPGKPKFFASAFETDGIAQPVMVTSYDYRPIKVDGNPKHPLSLGASDMATQASILGIYDPDRSQHVLHEGKQSSWIEFGTWAKETFTNAATNQGRGVAVIAKTTSSPTLLALKAQLKQVMPGADWHWYDGISDDNVRRGAELAYGKQVRTLLELAGARVILSLDDDFLGGHPAHVKYSRDWASARRPDRGADMSRMYVAESRMSITGGRADHRLPLRSHDIKAFALAVEHELRSHDVAVGGVAQSAGALASDHEVARFASAVAKDLAQNRGACVVTAGPGQSAEVHAIVHRMNAALGNVGSTVSYLDAEGLEQPVQDEGIAVLIDKMGKGQIETLIILGGNPVYNTPGALGFGEAYAKVKNRVALAEHVDETSRTATWHLNESHWLESWGDARCYDGTVSVVQPMIKPLYEGKSAIEVLSLVLAAAAGNLTYEGGYALVRHTFGKLASVTADDAVVNGAPNTNYNSQGYVKDSTELAKDPKMPVILSSFDRAWRQSLFDGVVANTAFAKTTPTLQNFSVSAVEAAASRDHVSNGELELVFYVDGRMHDGRYSNNAWLQETPDFITKLTWDNALLVSPKTAEALAVRDQQMVKVSVNGREMSAPVYIQPGQALGSIAIALGYGRTAAGRVGGWKEREVDHTIAGFDANVLRGASTASYVGGVKIAPTGDTFTLASTQDHWIMDDAGMKERERRSGTIVRTGTIEHYKEEPKFADEMIEHPPLESMWKEWEYNESYQWGMSIDLTTCTGCSACVVACTAENNVPVVGKEQVLRNREMHWIRIDRYFRGNPENPEVAGQVMLCQQCENAPCESVCPVGATSHSHEGLNDMAYNRCIGTRYCSNNCPYKVRRFNYFNYHENFKDTDRNEVMKMQNNPEVTVRFRGVMEKCTYCVQRIQNVKIVAKNDKRTIRDGEITPACAQACPTDAIVFGNKNDPTSRVAILKKLPRNYDVLAELNVKPRTSYLARITNPNPELEGAS